MTYLFARVRDQSMRHNEPRSFDAPPQAVVILKLAALLVTLGGCHAQNPYGLWGPYRIPPPTQAQALPYYPPTHYGGGADAATSTSRARASSNSGPMPSGSASGPAGRALSGAAGSVQARVSDAAEVTPEPPLVIEPEDRQPIRIVENPQSTPRMAQLPSEARPPASRSTAADTLGEAQGNAPSTVPPAGETPQPRWPFMPSPGAPQDPPDAAPKSSSRAPALQGMERRPPSSVVPTGRATSPLTSDAAGRMGGAVRPARFEEAVSTFAGPPAPDGWKTR